MSEISRYQTHAVLTQPPGHLIVMLCDGAIRFLQRAIEELEAGRYDQKGQSILRAIDILDELDLSLDVESGGEIAQNLRSLYDFMKRHLIRANLDKDPQRIREVIRLLQDLNEGWRTIAGTAPA